MDIKARIQQGLNDLARAGSKGTRLYLGALERTALAAAVGGRINGLMEDMLMGRAQLGELQIIPVLMTSYFRLEGEPEQGAPHKPSEETLEARKQASNWEAQFRDTKALLEQTYHDMADLRLMIDELERERDALLSVSTISRPSSSGPREIA